jgi:hypothetical protein
MERHILTATIAAFNNASPYKDQTNKDQTNYRVDIPAACRLIVDGLMRDLLTDGKIKSVVKGVDRMHAVRYEMGPGHREQLLIALRAELRRLGNGEVDE